MVMGSVSKWGAGGLAGGPPSEMGSFFAHFETDGPKGLGSFGPEVAGLRMPLGQNCIARRG
jgi:hypothetical protein